ncbi:unnamed protein product, partial [Closterium sp. NIES-54]
AHGPSAPATSTAATATTAPATTAPAATTTAAATAATGTASPAYCATMALLRVLAFDHEGRPWLTRDAAARLTMHNHLPLAKCTHLGQHRTAQALYDLVVTRYSSPATAALGTQMLPYLFPELSAFATVEDLVSHLRTSDARYSAALPAEFLAGNPPSMYITLYFVVTRLPDSLRSVREHFLSLDPTSLTFDLLEQHLLTAETSAIAVDISVDEDVGAASASAKRRSSKGKGGRGGGGSSGGGGGGSGSGGGGGGTGGGSGGSGGGGGGNGGSGGSGGGGTGGGRTGPWHGGPRGASETGTPPGTAPAEALHSVALDSGALRCFFHSQHHSHSSPCTCPGQTG